MMMMMIMMMMMSMSVVINAHVTMNPNWGGKTGTYYHTSARVRPIRSLDVFSIPI